MKSLETLEKIRELAGQPLKDSAMYGVVWSAHQLLRARGYHWEVRRNGELKIGLWRKRLKSGQKTQRKAAASPKRLAFIPGFGDTPLSWLPVMTLLESVLRSRFDEIVMLDFPGYNGLLSADGLFPSFDAVLDSTFDVMDSLKPHTVMGHSLGGFISGHYAAACSSGKRPTGRPQVFRSLDTTVVIDPSGVLASEAHQREWDSRLERLVKEGGEFWRPFIFAKEPFWFRFLAGHFMKFVSRAEVEPFVRSIGPQHNLLSVLPEVRSNFAILWGEKDSLIPAEFARAWARCLTNTPKPPSVTLIRGAGHSPQIEAPSATVAVLAQLFAGRTPHAWGARWYKNLEPN